MGMLMLETCEDNNVTNILLTNKENCALKVVDEIAPTCFDLITIIRERIILAC